MPSRPRLILLAALTALAATPAAAGAQVVASVADPAGDVTGDGTAPDVLGTTYEWIDGDPTTAADDALRVTTDVAAPFVGGDRLFWRIDADQNPATGEAGTGDEATARFDLLFSGPELSFFYYNPVRPADRATAPSATPTRFVWTKGLAALGLARGSTFRTRIYSDRAGGAEAFDFAPGTADTPPGIAVTIPDPPLRCIAPVVVTGQATAVDRTTATVTGTVSTGGSAARCTARWSVRYGPPGAPAASTPAVEIAGAGAVTPVSVALTGLVPGRSYEYRLVAENADASAAGATLRFRARPPAGLTTTLSPTTRRGGAARLLERLTLRVEATGGGPSMASLARGARRPAIVVQCLRGCTLRRTLPLSTSPVAVTPMRSGESSAAGRFFGPSSPRRANRVRFRGRARLAGDLAELFRDASGRRYVFPFGSAVEVRVTRPGYRGAISTIRLGAAVSRKSCPLDASGRPATPCRPS